MGGAGVVVGWGWRWGGSDGLVMGVYLKWLGWAAPQDPNQLLKALREVLRRCRSPLVDLRSSLRQVTGSVAPQSGDL